MALILSGDTGPSFVQDAAMPTGAVIQVVQGTTSTGVDISSTSYTDIGLSASITPSSLTSKILIIVTCSSDQIRQSSYITLSKMNIVRNSTQIYEKICGYGGAAVSTTTWWYVPHNPSMTYLDSPSTTSAITYKVQGKLDNTGNSSAIRMQIDGGTSSMILMEIVG